MSNAIWLKATSGLPTKSAKIRALDALGVARADIARFLGIRYQHVRNVLVQERPSSVQHAAEAATPYEDDDGKTRLLSDGSIRVPAAIASMIGATTGESLVAIPQDGGLWIATRKASRDHARAVAQSIIPKDVDWLDGLRDDRRRQFEREDRLARTRKG